MSLNWLTLVDMCIFKWINLSRLMGIPWIDLEQLNRIVWQKLSSDLNANQCWNYCDNQHNGGIFLIGLSYYSIDSLQVESKHCRTALLIDSLLKALSVTLKQHFVITFLYATNPFDKRTLNISTAFIFSWWSFESFGATSTVKLLRHLMRCGNLDGQRCAI